MGDLPSRTVFWVILTALFSIGIRVVADMPVPSLSVLGMYGATLLLWVLFMVYIKHRLSVTARDIENRTLYLLTEEDGISVYEFSTELRYHTAFEEITEVERGDLIYRISAPMGRICIPVRSSPAELRDRLESLEGAVPTARRWM